MLQPRWDCGLLLLVTEHQECKNTRRRHLWRVAARDMAGLHKIIQTIRLMGMLRTLAGFQVDLENTLTMSQLTGKSTNERHAVNLIIEIFRISESQTAAEVWVTAFTDEARNSGLKVSFAKQQAQLGVQEQVCERTVAHEMVHGLGPHYEIGLVRTQERRVSMTCFTSVGRRTYPSKMCGAIGSRTPRNFPHVLGVRSR